MRKSVHTPGYAALRRAVVAARGEAGLTQRELAARLDVPHSVVAKIESGERRIDPIELCWLLHACGADAVEVFREVSAHAGAPRGGSKRGRGGAR